MKKFYSFLLVCLTTIMAGFCFVSCGDDDDDATSNGSSSIVGTWNMNVRDGGTTYELFYTFCEDKTMYEYSKEDNVYYVLKGTYSFDEKSKKLIGQWFGDTPLTYTATIKGDEATLIGPDGEKVIAKKVKAPLSVKELEEIWNRQLSASGK